MTDKSAPLMAGGSKDWPGDAEHENGRYSCICVTCGWHFIGHKRRVVCKECSTKPENSAEALLRRVTNAVRPVWSQSPEGRAELYRIATLLSAPKDNAAPRVGLPLLYNIVCLWAQKKDDEWFKDMAEQCRIAEKLLYENGYEIKRELAEAVKMKSAALETAANVLREASAPSATAPLPKKLADEILSIVNYEGWQGVLFLKLQKALRRAIAVGAMCLAILICHLRKRPRSDSHGFLQRRPHGRQRD